MADSFNYALTLNDNGVYVLRSTVESFNLQQVTDKDIISFYQTFSNSAAFDTGLLPLDGTGVLAIRTAGNHMQVTVQHKPGLYYINWGAHEGDSSAKTYNLAQPYRIIIGDFVDGQLLGARMFYSPYPITHPDMPLYHVNLPNINCKGYRGNGVGWICLYLKEDWSNLPLNEKIARFIERCSGVETYNDANMSETDGPRFYKEIYGSDSDYDYLWNPASWERKSSREGYEWTLNSDLWSPVKVTSIDKQGQHDENGIQLTLAGALLGNYQAYYTDNSIPKFYNVVSRQDLNLTNEHVAKFVKKSFAAASVSYNYNDILNPLSSMTKAREEKSNSSPELPFEESEEDEDNYICYSCDTVYSDEPIFDHQGNPICDSCQDAFYVYIDSVGEYFHHDHDDIVYDDDTNMHYHIKYDTVVGCKPCGHTFYYPGKQQISQDFFDFVDDNQIQHTYCTKCMEAYASEIGATLSKCVCEKQTFILEHVQYTVSSMYQKSFLMPTVNWDNDQELIEYGPKHLVYCASCMDSSILFKQPCPCGILVDTDQINKCAVTPVLGSDGQYQIQAACSQCIGNIKVDPETGIGLGEFIPINPYQYTVSVAAGVTVKSPYVLPSAQSIIAQSTDPF